MNEARQVELQQGLDLLLAGHGVRGACASATVSAHDELVAELRTAGKFNQIRWGYLTCEPYVDDVAASLCSATVHVVPMMMSDGYFSKTAIPKKLGLDGRVSCRENGQQIIQCSPIGVSEMMGDVITARLLDYCRENDLSAGDTPVIVIGHGSSKNAASRLAVTMQVRAIKHRHEFKDVQEAFLEEMPDLPSVMRGIAGKALVIGYFANRGHHATTDVCNLILHSGLSADYLGPVGALPAISEVVMDCVDRSLDPSPVRATTITSGSRLSAPRF